MEFDVLQSGMVILLILVLGELVSNRCRGIVPSILIAGLLYTVGCWSGIVPKGIVDLAGIGSLASVAMMLVVVNMGTSMSISEFIANWKVVALSAITFAGQVLALFLVVGSVYDINTAVGGLPGGTATALIVQERARGFGYDRIVVLSVLILATQALVGCPVASHCVKLEAARLRTVPRTVPTEQDSDGAAQREAKKKTLQYGPLLRLYGVAWLASRLEMLIGLSRYVLCLLLGLLLSGLGLLKKNELAASKSDGFLFFLLMSAVISGFSAATPQMFAQMLPPLLLVLLTELVSVTCVSLAAGHFLGFSRPMRVAIGINIMIGFPVNMLISQEVIGQLTEDPEEQAYLMSQIATKMVIGGMVSTTFLATATAGVLVSLMT